MPHHSLHQLGLPAPYIRSQLVRLEAERVLTPTGGAPAIDAHLEEIRDEIAIWRELYTVSAVTEIATLRAQFGGPQLG
jgi:hypothetical protein